MKLILLIGGGGHCRSCIDVIEQEKKYEIAGIIDNAEAASVGVLGYKVLGSDHDLPKLVEQVPVALVTIGQIKSPENRIRLFNLLNVLGASLPIIQSPSAYISPHAKVGSGSILMHGAVICPNANIGKNCIINSQALIEHDASIEDHCHISTGAKINGGVVVGRGSFVGSGAVIKEGVRIGHNCIIGAGMVLLKELPPNNIYCS